MLVDRLESETDERLRANLEIVARHVVAEVGGDIPALMATLVGDPHYTFAGALGPYALDGRDQIKQMYEATVENGDNRLEFHLACVIVDRGAVLTEGIFRQVFSGGILNEIGASHDEEIASDGWYLTEQGALIVWPISPGGLIEGERVCFAEKHRVIRAVASDEFTHIGPVDRDAVGGRRESLA
jgi:hypothetical protein